MKTIVVFGSSLTSREPRDLDFAYSGCSYEEAVACVLEWRKANLSRWTNPPETLHGVPGLLTDGEFLVGFKPGQEPHAPQTIAGAAPRFVYDKDQAARHYADKAKQYGDIYKR